LPSAEPSWAARLFAAQRQATRPAASPRSRPPLSPAALERRLCGNAAQIFGADDPHGIVTAQDSFKSDDPRVKQALSHPGVLRDSFKLTGAVRASLVVVGLNKGRSFLVATKRSALPHLGDALQAVTAQYRKVVPNLTCSLDPSPDWTGGPTDPRVRPEVRVGCAAEVARLSRISYPAKHVFIRALKTFAMAPSTPPVPGQLPDPPRAASPRNPSVKRPAVSVRPKDAALVSSEDRMLADDSDIDLCDVADTVRADDDSQH